MSADPSAVRALFERVLGSDAGRFTLNLTPAPTEFFEVSVTGDHIQVTGSTLPALARGAYHYLKQNRKYQYWPGNGSTLANHFQPDTNPTETTCVAPGNRAHPAGLPAPGNTTHHGSLSAPGTGPTPEGSRTIARWSQTPDQDNAPTPRTPEGSQNPGLNPVGPRSGPTGFIRYYLSVCTFGYTTPWWDWSRWEQEIDWMALRGINMPLALTGQELIWQRVFRRLGLINDQIGSFFSGPAYLPWHRLGNLDGVMGPLSQEWIDRQADLQKKILARQRELGMAPVVPGFSGFVPPAFAECYPEVRLRSAEPWAGFPPTTYIDPLDPMFVEVGALFVEEYRREYGEAHHYLCETFAEQLPQIEPGHELEHLRAIGAAIWESLHRSDPDCHWVMQGWPFHFGREFWTPERGNALFEAVPDGRTIILDQVTESYEIWRDQPILQEKGWIHCAVHNYGQNTHLHGDLDGFARRSWEAQSSLDKGRMLGMGIVPEGLDQNPVVYELLTDLMWSAEPIDVDRWIVEYAHSRYGANLPSTRTAWQVMLNSVYGKETEQTLRFSWRYRPGDQPILADLDLAKIRLALEPLFDVSSQFVENQNYLRDLVDVAKTWLGAVTDALLAEALADPADRNKLEHFFNGLKDLDRLLATRPEHRLSTWLAAARQAATSPEEADRFEHNARSLITHWGGPVLFDYAVKEWAGLTLDFHLERWRLYFENQGQFDFPQWERNWAKSTTPPSESEPEDPIALIKDLLDRYPNLETTKTICHDLGLFVANGSIEVNFPEPRLLAGLALYPMFGQGFCGSYSIDVDNVCVHRAAAPTYRGARASFEARPVTQLRIAIETLQGEANQQFQVLTFEPTSP